VAGWLGLSCACLATAQTPQTLRIDQAGKTRRVYVRRRDLIRAHGLQPRDLRRVDPSLRCAAGATRSRPEAAWGACPLHPTPRSCHFPAGQGALGRPTVCLAPCQ
jgi:hypothetical protein